MMKRLTALLALCLLPLHSWAITGTADQCVADDVGAATTITVDGTDGWATPTSGDLLVAYVAVDRDGVTTSATWTQPSGFTVALSNINTTSGAVNHQVSWKVSDGTETSIAASLSADVGDKSLTVCELPIDGLDLSAIEASVQDVTNETTTVTAQTAGSVANTTADALVIATVHPSASGNWFASESWNNSFVSQFDYPNVARAGTYLATKVVSATATQTTTNTTTDTGDYATGTILIFGAAASTTVTYDAATYDLGDTIGATATGFSSTLTTITNTNSAAAGATFDFGDRDLDALDSYFARTGVQTGQDASGDLYEAADGVEAYVLAGSRTGLLFEGVAATNAVPHANDLDTSSTKRGAATATYAATDGPLSGYTALSIGTLGVDDVYRGYSVTGSASDPIAMSFWLRKNAATGTLVVKSPQAGTVGEWSIDLSLVDAGWQRITVDHAAVTETAAFIASASVAAGWWFSHAGGTISIDVAEINQVVDDEFVTSEIPTTGSAATRNASTLNDALFSALGLDSGVTDLAGAFAVYHTMDNDDARGGYQRYLGSSDSAYQEGWSIGTGPSNDAFFFTKFSGGAQVAETSTAAAEHSYSVGDISIIRYRLTSAGMSLWIDTDSGGSTVDASTTAGAQADFASALDRLHFAKHDKSSAHPSFVMLSMKQWSGTIPSDATLAAMTLEDFDAFAENNAGADTITAEPGATSSLADFGGCDLTDMTSTGLCNNTPMGILQTYEITDGTDTATDTLTYNFPATATGFSGQLACDSASCPDDSIAKLQFSAAVTGDWYYCRTISGVHTLGGTPDYLVPYTTVDGTFECRIWDVSLSSWIEPVQLLLNEPETSTTCAQVVREMWRDLSREAMRNPACVDLNR